MNYIEYMEIKNRLFEVKATCFYVEIISPKEYNISKCFCRYMVYNGD